MWYSGLKNIIYPLEWFVNLKYNLIFIINLHTNNEMNIAHQTRLIHH